MSRRAWFERLAVAALVSTFILICVGAYVVKIGAGQACPTWPGCFDDHEKGFVGNWFPFADPDADLHGFTVKQVAAEWIHRLIAMIVGFLVLGLVVLAPRLKPVDRRVRLFATLSGVFLLTQIALGGVTVLLGNAPWTVVLHQGNAMLVFGALTVLVTLTFNTRTGEHANALASSLPSPSPDGPSGAAPGEMTSRPWTASLQQKLGPWFELIKPGILLLLVMCGAAAMFLAGSPSWRLVAATLLGGALAASSAAAFNNYLDRHRDAMLARTRKRSIPSSRIPPQAALVFAFATGIAAFVYLGTQVNWLTAALAIAGILFYVYYTIWLKPQTAQNIVIGGAAGAAPALVGWAAVTGQLELPALVLGFIIFAWTPPHFWALALVYKDDYAKGAVPMYPVVKGEVATRRAIFAYTLLTVLATLVFVPLQTLGVIYLVAALVLGAWFIALAVRLLVRKDNKAAYAVFGYSIVYLGLLFGAMVVDRLVLG